MRTLFFSLALLLVVGNVLAYCGDGVCNTVAGESRSSCCSDCACGYNQVCSDSESCVAVAHPTVQVTGYVSRLYGFDGWFAILVAVLSMFVLLLYKFKK